MVVEQSDLALPERQALDTQDIVETVRQPLVIFSFELEDDGENRTPATDAPAVDSVL
jgi:hypothetical protein